MFWCISDMAITAAKPQPAPTRRLSRRSQVALQRAFFARMGGPQQLQRLFEHLPDIAFFLKDDRGRLICAGRPIFERFGLSEEIEIVGRTDHELYPPHLAQSFMEDDAKVIRTGQPLLNRVEVWFNEQRMFDWFVTTKLPVFGRSRRVIGVMGTLRSYTGKKSSKAPSTQFDKALERVRTNHTRLTVSQLAKLACLSERQLHRRFMVEFGMCASTFLMKTRIQAAIEVLLHSDRPIAHIASDLEFCDQSNFTRQFRERTGTTPLVYRRKYRGEHGMRV
jgi:AraC-like DNA-binding protein